MPDIDNRQPDAEDRGEAAILTQSIAGCPSQVGCEQRAEEERTAGQREAEPVERLGVAVLFVGQQRPADGEGYEAERQVEVEDPAPGQAVGDQAAQRWPEDEGDERRPCQQRDGVDEPSQPSA